MESAEDKSLSQARLESNFLIGRVVDPTLLHKSIIITFVLSGEAENTLYNKHKQILFSHIFRTWAGTKTNKLTNISLPLSLCWAVLCCAVLGFAKTAEANAHRKMWADR